MKEIFDQLAKPEWWFTAVFVAIIAGIAGAFAKDALSATFATLSKSFATRRQRSKDREAARVALLAREPPLLVIMHIQVVVGLILVLLMYGLVLSLPAWRVLVAYFPDVDPLSLTGGRLPARALMAAVSAFTGLCAIYMQWRLMSIVILCRKGRSAYLNARIAELSQQP